MEEENLKRQEEIKDRVIAIYDNIQRKNEAEENEKKLDKVVYYETIRLNSEEGAIEFYNVYIVRIIDPLEKALYEIYDDEMLIATINENGHIEFSENYKQRLNEQNNGLFINAISKMEKSKAKLEEPEELGENDKEFVEQDILEEKKKKEEATKQQEANQEENVTDLNEDEIGENIAETLGISRSDIVCRAEVNPKQILADNEELGKQTFEDIVGVEQGKYKKVYVVNSNSKIDKNKKFAFLGVTQDGKIELIDKLKTKGTTQKDRRVYSINRDGSTVKELQTYEMFGIEEKEDKAFSVTVVEYGKIKINILRRGFKEGEWIGPEVETNEYRRTKKDVNKYMGDNKTTKRELTASLTNTKEQIVEKGSNKTDVRNIDTNPNNDRALPPDEEIKLHNEETTTLRKESERLGLSLEEYNKRFEKAKGDCPSDKIMNVRQEKLEEKTLEPEDRGDRGERPTPEDEAWIRKENGGE